MHEKRYVSFMYLPVTILHHEVATLRHTVCSINVMSESLYNSIPRSQVYNLQTLDRSILLIQQVLRRIHLAAHVKKCKYYAEDFSSFVYWP